MKICIVLGGYIVYGGIQNLLLELSRELVRQGHEVRIICRGASVPVPDGVGLEVITRKPYTLGVYSTIGRLRREGKIDVVHALGCAGINVVFNRLFHGIPYLLTLHSTAVSEYRVSTKTFREKLTYSLFYLEECLPAHFADSVACISRYTLGEVHRYYFVPDERLKVIYIGIDRQKFRMDSPPAKNGRSILMVGRIDPRKGYLEFFEHAAPVIVNGNSGARINVVGNEFPEYRAYSDKIRESIARHGIDKNVNFLGGVSLEDLKRLYNSSDIFIQASKEEGFGIALIEAQSCGIPIVAFNLSAIKETVSNEKTGFLVSGYEDMAGRTLELLEKDQLRISMGEAAIGFAAGFSWAEIARQYVDEYLKISKRKL